MGFSVNPYRQFLWLGIAMLSLVVPAVCQSASAPVVPQTIKYDGLDVKHARETVETVFRIYSAMVGSEPLWSETQQISVGADGKYSVFLGADTPGGLPQTVFAAGQARWLGIAIAGSPEQARVPLVSVAYAMKAADAETLGGLSAGEFVTKSQLGTQLGAVAAVSGTASANPDANPSGTGTAGSIAVWTNSTTLGSSAITQAGTSTVPLIGVGTTSPTTLLDVNGATTQRGNLTLSTLEAATSTAGVPSPELLLTASSFLKASAAVRQTFVWQAQPMGNDTATPGANLSLLFASGSNAPAATGLTISPKGVFTFAAGQTFPGTGTITGITASSPLTGGGTTGAVTVGLNTSALETTLNTVYPRLSAANTFAGNQTVTGNVTASGSVTGEGGNASYGVNGSTNSTTQLAAGVSGSEGATAGQVFGVSGVAYSSTSGAAGVRGHEYATSGPVFGVLGANESSGPGAAGVAGSEHATTGLVYGVSGSTNSTTNGAAGLSGQEGAVIGQVYGVTGGTSSTTTNAAGVTGSEGAATGQVYGVTGATASITNGAAGVSGWEGAKTGSVYGVSGSTNSAGPYAAAVSAYEGATTGVNWGVQATSNSSQGIGVQGSSPNEGIAAFSQSCGSSGCAPTAGTAGLFATGSGGYLIRGLSGPAGTVNPTYTQVFGVDASGNETLAGNLHVSGSIGFSGGISGQISSANGSGIMGTNLSATGGNGVFGISDGTSGNGVLGVNNATSAFAVGVTGITNSPNGAGINGFSNTATGGIGVNGNAGTNGTAILGGNQSCSSSGCIYAAGTALSLSTGSGGTLIYAATGPAGSAKSAAATTEFTVDASGNGYFAGNLNVKGTLSKGGGSFKIDDPLDPAHKYLSHSFVESPDMMNVYNGNVVTDRHGYATVVLPDYFDALNREFRYQLTVLGQFAQAIVAKKIAQNRFVIRTNKPNVEVSWQVTGIRQDAWANANRIAVEEEKPAAEQGHYLHPEVFGQPANKSVAAAARANSSLDGLRSGSQ